MCMLLSLKHLKYNIIISLEGPVVIIKDLDCQSEEFVLILQAKEKQNIIFMEEWQCNG